MILIDTFNIRWTPRNFLYSLDYIIPMLFLWLVLVGGLWLIREIAKQTNTYDAERDGIIYKFGFWIGTFFLWGLAGWMALDSLLLHTSSSFDGFWIIALFGFIAYNILKILSRH